VSGSTVRKQTVSLVPESGGEAPIIPKPAVEKNMSSIVNMKKKI
jgi:hypothetical protein